jgi:phage tail-like protein
MALTKRGYVSSHFALELSGGFAGFLKSVDGGNLKAPVMTEPAGADNYVHKHIGSPDFDEISFQIGLSTSVAVNQWIKDSWGKEYARKDGAIHSCDFNYKSVSTRTFTNALITEVGFPALDGTSKEAAYLNIKIKPEEVKFKKGDKQVVRGTFTENQKVWVPSNFRIELDQLNCKYISKVDAFTLKQTVTRYEIGETRNAQLEPTKLEYPNLTFYIAESHAGDWMKWAEDFILNGNNEKEKQGAIHFLSPNLQSEIGSMKLHNVGCFSIGVEKSEAGAESIKRVKVELYVEEMDFKPASAYSLKVG